MNKSVKTKPTVALYLTLGKLRQHWNGLGGADKRLCYLISHINPNHYTITIVIRFNDDISVVNNALRPYISENCHITIVRNDIEAIAHFIKNKYDCVFYDDIMYSAKPGIIGAWLVGSRNTLIFVTVSYSHWEYRKKWYGAIMWQNVQMAKMLDCLYPDCKESLHKRFPNKQIRITPCSLPLLDDYINESTTAIKENLIVFAGRLIPEKNPMLFLEAMSKVINQLRRKNYTVLICGDGSLKLRVEEIIDAKNLGDRIKCLGIQNMKNILPIAKIFLSLQHTENYPSQSLLEAIACGCYCIATKVGNTKELVMPSFGLLVTENVDEIDAAICKAMNMSCDDFSKTAEEARKFARKHFNPNAAISHYEEICEELLY